MADEVGVDVGLGVEDQPLLPELKLVEEPEPGFLGRIRRRIERRILTSDFLDLSWFSPVFVLLEYIDMIFQALRGPKKEV